MHSLSRRSRAAAALALGSATLLSLGRPTGGQQNQPAISATVPASVARGATARVQCEITLPAGAKLARNPRVRVTSSQGRLWELLPLLITQTTPTVKAYRDLHSENYWPGTYQVSVEADYSASGGPASTTTTA